MVVGAGRRRARMKLARRAGPRRRSRRVKRPVMPRCMTSTSPEERSASRYLARRRQGVDVSALQALGEALGKGKAQVRPALLDLRQALRRPWRAPGRGGPSRLRAVRASTLSRAVPWPSHSLRGPASAMDRGEASEAAMTGRRRHAFRLQDRPARARSRAAVDDVFRSVARRYDLMNDLMSGGPAPGLEGRPRHGAAAAARTGRSAISTSPAAPATSPSASSRPAGRRPTSPSSTSTATCSPSAASARPRDEGRLDFVEANAEALPFPDRSFDAYTIAFGIRNVPRIEAALREACRVLRRGGRFLCLEFSKVDVPGLDALYDAYSFNVIPRLGRHRRRRCRALPLSRRIDPPLPAARRLRADDRGGGLQARHRTGRLTGGIVAIHSGWKL